MNDERLYKIEYIRLQNIQNIIQLEMNYIEYIILGRIFKK